MKTHQLLYEKSLLDRNDIHCILLIFHEFSIKASCNTVFVGILCKFHFIIDITDGETFHFLEPYIADQALVCDQGGPRWGPFLRDQKSDPKLQGGSTMEMKREELHSPP